MRAALVKARRRRPSEERRQWRSSGGARAGSGDVLQPVAAWVSPSSERSGRARRAGSRSGGGVAKLGRLARRKRRRAPARGRVGQSQPVNLDKRSGDGTS